MLGFRQTNLVQILAMTLRKRAHEYTREVLGSNLPYISIAHYLKKNSSRHYFDLSKSKA